MGAQTSADLPIAFILLFILQYNLLKNYAINYLKDNSVHLFVFQKCIEKVASMVQFQISTVGTTGKSPLFITLFIKALF